MRDQSLIRSEPTARSSNASSTVASLTTAIRNASKASRAPSSSSTLRLTTGTSTSTSSSVGRNTAPRAGATSVPLSVSTIFARSASGRTSGPVTRAATRTAAALPRASVGDCSRASSQSTVDSGRTPVTSARRATREERVSLRYALGWTHWRGARSPAHSLITSTDTPSGWSRSSDGRQKLASRFGRHRSFPSAS